MMKVFSYITGAILVFAIGCSIQSKPQPADYSTEFDAVDAGKKAILLLKINVTVNGQPSMDPAESFEFGLANVSAGEIMKPTLPFKSTEEKKTGWVVFVVEPGNYNFWAIPPHLASKGYPERYRFQVTIPYGARISYAGSLNIQCAGGSFLRRKARGSGLSF